MDRRVPDRTVDVFTTTYNMATYVVNSNPAQTRCAHYMKKFVNDLGRVSGFLLVRQFPPSIN